ncbi:hypothetical protein [Pseudanabaena phage PA-SR01]|nr:hypothetical protein [Pseudanabaena phage PA-SR01]
MNSFYLSDLIGISVPPPYTQTAIDKELKDFYTKASIATQEELCSPTVVFENGYIYDNAKGNYEFIVSLGIFSLDTTSATATITKDNKLELTWTGRAGKGRFTSKIPSYLIPTSAPVLSYEGGVLDIRVPVESRSKNDTLFVGKLSESKS